MKTKKALTQTSWKDSLFAGTTQDPQYATETKTEAKCELCGKPLNIDPKAPNLQSDLKWFQYHYCLKCTMNNPKIKNEILAWFDSRPALNEKLRSSHDLNSNEVYNPLTFLPELAEFFEHNAAKSKQQYELCPECKAIGITTTTKQYLHDGHLYTSTIIIHPTVTKEQVQEWRNNLNEFYKFAVPQIGLYSLFNYVIRDLLERASLNCESRTEAPIPHDRYNENERTFRWTTCPKCGQFGEAIIRMQSDHAYTYVRHYDQRGSLSFTCYIRKHTDKNPLQICPRCGKKGRKTVDRHGHVRFKHYSNNTRRVCYIKKKRV